MNGKELLKFLLSLSDEEREQYEFSDTLNIYLVRESVYRAVENIDTVHVCYEEMNKIADAIYPKVREQLISEMINGYSDIYNDMDTTHRQHIDDVVEEQVLQCIKGNVQEMEEKIKMTNGDRIRALSDEDLAKLFICGYSNYGKYDKWYSTLFAHTACFKSKQEAFEATIEELKKEVKDE